jgi:hypothetical protein
MPIHFPNRPVVQNLPKPKSLGGGEHESGARPECSFFLKNISLMWRMNLVFTHIELVLGR